MHIKPNPNEKPKFGVSGHVGAGHVHSHKGFIQDDSGGFAVTTSLIRIAYPADTSIHRVSCTQDVVEVETVEGGIGRATARRGFTRYEEELLQRSLGLDGIYSQSLSCRCFGRIYGQGVMEAPVAFQTATCLAVIDTFHRKYPDHIKVSEEGLQSNVGKCMGALIDIEGSCIAVMAVVNASRGGIGPVEDLEGNISLAEKGSLMEEIGLDKIPTIIIEGKAYVPTFSSTLEQNTFWIRFNEEFDNPAVGDALIKAAANCPVPSLSSNTAYPRYTGEMKETTRVFGQKIIDIGRKIESSSHSQEKAKLIAELALLVSQDAGGITYMTDSLHEIVAGGGLVPGLAAVLSIAVSQKYIEENLIPEITPEDVDSYLNIIVLAIEFMSKDPQSLENYIKRKDQFDVNILGELVQA
ncbi:MAG: hypothetical protein KJO60_11400 [Desulfofustis sp.]|nr:hypothetical protein [Desulfofustis sp.]